MRRPARVRVRTLLLTLSVAGAAAPAGAQPTAFTSRAAFQSAAGALTTETFDRPFTLVPTAGAVFAVAGGTVTFDANHGDMTFGGGDLFADLHPAGDAQGPRFLRFTFAAPVTAFGADFGAFDSPALLLRAFVGGRTFDVAQGFFGVVSATPFTTVALRDADGGGRAETRRYFGAVRANGVLVARHALYVAYRDQIVRYRLTPGELVPPGAPEVVVSGLPFAGDHFRKNIQTDGRSALYVNLGSASNACQVANRQLHSPGVDPCPELDVRAGIWRFDLNATGQTPASGTRYAAGYRNTEALRYDPVRRALFGVPHGRDMLDNNWPELFTTQQGADLPSEEFVRIGQGTDNGWPYCYHDWQRGAKVLAPEYGGDGAVVGPRCAWANAPLLTYPGHWAPNDLLFYYGAQFPARYRGGAFVAFHGGFDRAPLPNEGYHVAFVPFGADAPSGASETFADGFTGGGTPLPAAAAHRPMGLAEGADGSLYVTDDRGGRIWRIVYRGR